MSNKEIKELREKFFKECVDWKSHRGLNGIVFKYEPVINMAPHDLFEWFVKNMK